MGEAAALHLQYDTVLGCRVQAGYYAITQIDLAYRRSQ